MTRKEKLRNIKIQYEGIQIANKCFSDNTYMEWKNKYNGNIPYSIITQYVNDKLFIKYYESYELYIIRKTFLDQLMDLIEQYTIYKTSLSLEIPYHTILKIE